MLLLLVAGLYASNSGAPLVFDDQTFFGSNYVSAFGAAFRPDIARYWPYATFVLQSLWLDQMPEQMRPLNYLLHAACAVALQHLLARFLLLARSNVGEKLFASGRRPPAGGYEEGVAWFVAAVFVLHPVAVYAVAYLVQRSMLLATLASLLMWHTFLTGLQRGSSRWLWGSVICFYFAVFSKEHAVAAPILPVALVLLFWHPKTIAAARRGLQIPQMPQISLSSLLAILLAWLAIALAAILPSARLLGTDYEPLLLHFPMGADWHEHLWGLERVHWMSILSQCHLFFKYLSVWLWPDPAALSIDMREPFLTDLTAASSWSNLLLWLAFGGGALALILAGRHWRRAMPSLVGVGLLTCWGLFVVELTTVRWQEIFVLYRSYLWMTGLALGGALLLQAVVSFLQRRCEAAWAARTLSGILVLGMFFVLGLLALLAHQRLQIFSSDLAVWQDAVRLIEQRRGHGGGTLPGDERAYFNRGIAYMQHKEDRAAEADFVEAIRLNPGYEDFHLNLGVVQFRQHQDAAALSSLARALALRPGFTAALMQRATVLEHLGRIPEALADFQRACVLGSMQGCWYHHRHTHPADTPFVFVPQGHTSTALE
ncbi:MAG: tetratricopeptide repeat protein [Sterolibacterium sp.]|nr:tetratricopeptide repeat protein [Sterolibacterium sp.]MBP9799749.1 tetratricopeptide repeat protein [Sterolibacterium sp.]